MDIERQAFETEFKKTKFYENMQNSLENADCPFTSVFEMRNGEYRSTYVNLSFEVWQAAKAQAVPEGFVLVSAEQMSQWGYMANCAQEYGCPECFEARGYAHNLGCEINAYFNVSEAQEPAND